MRNRLAEILLFLSWPICLIHRIWNNDPITPVRWIIFDKSVCEDFRWVLVYNELWLSSTLVIAAILIMKTKTLAIILLFRALLGIAIVDIINYWLWFRRKELMLTLEGLIMVIFCTAIFIKSQKK